ncbi:40-residue YVTN family beta-propeller repeat protein [Ancylobacter novellus DSM 506]|uniref:40-residue YVTN family beta-propeller repeat protein n=1 Tax=Ancylobacter novellus (strain ATCC 8093 / DSM 506 / JCM 20403 / CCM 1077 / IAM 12100 / NBRC 12443 / NCIMB 10456) TaxID=639283 RepID=D7A8S5_ANCN5|nr:YncE family protein [Ancylobacter novellus]ADH90609.1 40-residue YVTN family beta-propeller repeat protein [Ancylobacter novellus DSM 506]
MPIEAPVARPRPKLLRLAPFAATLAALAWAALAGTAAAEPQYVKSVKPGAGLYEIVFSPVMNRVYVAAAGTRGASETFVYGLDPATLETKETIALGDDPVFGLGINNKTRTLYGTQTRDGSLAVIDLTTGKPVAKLAKGEKAHVREVAVDEANDRAYVTVLGMRDKPSAVWIVDGAKKEIVDSIDDLAGGIAGISLDARNNRLFLSALQANEVVVVDLATKKVTNRFPSGGEGSINLVYDASGDQVFVANQGSGEVTALDAKDGSVIKKIPTGGGALSVAIDPERSILYVANRTAGFVSLIDTKTLEPIANVVTGSMPQTVAVDAATGNAYVTNKLKTAGRPRPPAPPAGAAAPGATPAAPAPAAAAPAATPAAAPSAPPAGERARPVPMVDPYGDSVTLIKP